MNNSIAPDLSTRLLTEKVMPTIVPGQQCTFIECEENCTRCAYYTFTRHLVADKVEKPSKIHSPYFISITLHLCILIKFSAFFCTVFSMLFVFNFIQHMKDVYRFFPYLLYFFDWVYVLSVDILHSFLFHFSETALFTWSKKS